MRAAVLVLLAACAARRGADADLPVETPPAWSTPDGAEQTRLQLVEALLESGSPDAALAMVGRLRADGLGGADLDVLQARALVEVGLLDDAEAILDGTVRRNRRHADAWNALGVLRMERRDAEGAATAFRAATRAAPDDPQAWNNLGFTLHSLRRSDEAVDALREALRLNASDVRIRNNLGYALVAAGRVDEAWRTFRASTPEPDARYNLALGLELAGDTARARDEYSRVLAADPDHTQAQDALARLDAPAAAPPSTEPAP
jgi:Flp pilus assembly protein TadD